MGGFTSPGPNEKEALLKEINVKCFNDLLTGIPAPLRLKSKLALPAGISEFEALQRICCLSNKNISHHNWNVFLGAGLYDHYIPAATQSLTSRSEFLTAYTPYQAEVSQGTLQAIYEYQSMICELTGLDVANASLYDGATALAEAMHMARTINRKGTQFIIPKSLNPFYTQVLKTYSRGLKLELVEIGYTEQGTLDLDALKSSLNDEVFGIAVMSPNFFGILEDIAEIVKVRGAHQGSLIVVPSLLSLALFEPPGDLGADICVGEAHYFTSGPGFGGPLVGFMSTSKKNIRQIPGRIAGKTVDREGKQGFVLTAQTREQHIRRERATSNICTSEALLALGTTITLSLLGKEGFHEMAMLNVNKTQYALSQLRSLPNLSFPFSGPVFNEFVVALESPGMDALFDRAKKKKIIPGYRLDKLDKSYGNKILISITEKKTKSDIDALVEVFTS